MTWIIRECKPSDLEDLMVLCCNHAEHERVVYDPQQKADSLMRALFSEKKLLHCWVVESERQLAGYCSFTFDYSTWDASPFLHMDCLYLEPEFRSKGIGEEIIRRLKVVADENHCINVQWQTPTFNKRAINFYRRIGATEKEKKRFFL